MTVVWWLLWGAEAYAALVLAYLCWKFSRMVAQRSDLIDQRDSCQRQADFWRERCRVLDDRLRKFGRVRGDKGRFVGKAG